MKIVRTDKYAIAFNRDTGVEILTGINGNPDPFVLEYPSMIDIGIMGHCRNNCDFCYQGSDSQPNMTLEDFKLIVDQSKDYVNQVALGGRGDPNLHENFEEIIKYARDNGIVPNYTTSGIGLRRRHIELTKEYCGAVAVSDYRRPFSYRALKMFMKAGIKTNIHFIFSKLTHLNTIELLNGGDVWDGNVDIEGLNAVIFLLFKPQGNAKEMSYLKPANGQIRLLSEAIKNPKTKFKIGLDSCLVNKISNLRELTRSEELFADTCEGSRMSCYITPDMRLVPCSFGNNNRGHKIKDSSIKRIWDHGMDFLQFRKQLKSKSDVCPYELRGWK